MGRFRFLAMSLLLAVSSLLRLSAYEINSLDITVLLRQDGSAVVTQKWDIYADSGTEWYVPISNLDNMSIRDLTVSENGMQYICEPQWNTKWSFNEKTGRCGILRKGGGDVELCWGVGQYGSHLWTVSYVIEGLVQSFQDYDGFNFQFINTGLDPAPRSASLCIQYPSSPVKLSSDNTRVWGFGYEGNIYLEDSGDILATASEPMSSKGSMIALVRFDKGLFTPSVSRDAPFSKLEKKAKKGSIYSSGTGDLIDIFFEILIGLVLLFTPALILYYVVAGALGYKWKKRFFGQKKITTWFRDAPFEGNLAACYYLWYKGRDFPSGKAPSNMLGAYFLKWILEGIVKVQKDPSNDKQVILDFGEELPDLATDIETHLYRMAMEASGKNHLLEPKEFERWAKKHASRVAYFPNKVLSAGKSYLVGHKILKGDSVAESKRDEARRVVEFSNFLKDFTLTNEREVAEVALWKDYLVFAQMYGIADKVARQFKKLYPTEFKEFTQTVGIDNSDMFYRMIVLNNMMSNSSFRSAREISAGRSASGGFGGGSSFGGGGGFSGGGFGGGTR